MEEAMNCVDDLRQNKSGNIPVNCEMNSLRMETQTQCCPRLITDQWLITDLEFIGAGYPMALDCMASVGCANELIYSQLLDECHALCSDVDTRPASFGNNLCTAMFNSAPASSHVSIVRDLTRLTGSKNVKELTISLGSIASKNCILLGSLLLAVVLSFSI